MKAFNMLQKMGWQPGQGLGKHEQGNSRPVSTIIKPDNSGIGMNEDWSNDFENMYDKLAKSLTVKSSKKNSKKRKSKECELKLSRSSASEDPSLGKTFVKSTTSAKPNSSSKPKSAKPPKTMYNSRMSGKLKRLSRQDGEVSANIQKIITKSWPFL
uniref:G-patch domain-containing protein n=1 Tax=Spongospora subterranea TaxID=70186 RepID=A0A0H5RAC1_9EUKA|eukprot:CRZ11100.1 hypothetical protein [Spongospora subterranea]